MNVTFARVVRSEWTKMVTLRANWIVLAGVPVFLIGLAAVIGANNAVSSPTLAVGGGFLLYALAIGVFGVLMMTSEYSSGLIRSSLVAVPHRLPVLWAKAFVLVAASAPVMLVSYFGSFLANQAFAAQPLSLGDPSILRALFGVAGATLAAGLMGLTAGTLLRSTPGAIFAFVAALIVLPQALLGALPASAQDFVLPFVPTLALQAMFQVGADTALVSPLKATIVVGVWVILMLGGAAAVLHRRDV